MTLSSRGSPTRSSAARSSPPGSRPSCAAESPPPDARTSRPSCGRRACSHRLDGAALLYGIGFSSYPVSVQAVTPFLFPAAALGGAIALHRARRPAWEAELAGMVGYLAFGLASITSAVATGAGPGFGIVASVAATAIVLALHAALRMVRLTGWGLSASLVAFTGFCADAGGILERLDRPLVAGAAGRGCGGCRRAAPAALACRRRGGVAIGCAACDRGGRGGHGRHELRPPGPLAPAADPRGRGVAHGRPPASTWGA